MFNEARELEDREEEWVCVVTKFTRRVKLGYDSDSSHPGVFNYLLDVFLTVDVREGSEGSL